MDDDITDILSMRLQHAPIADVELAVEPVVEQAIVPAVPHVEPVAARVPKRKFYNTYVNGVRHRTRQPGRAPMSRREVCAEARRGKLKKAKERSDGVAAEAVAIAEQCVTISRVGS